MGVRDAPGSEKPGVDRQEEEGGEQDEVNPALKLLARPGTMVRTPTIVSAPAEAAGAALRPQRTHHPDRIKTKDCQGRPEQEQTVNSKVQQLVEQARKLANDALDEAVAAHEARIPGAETVKASVIASNAQTAALLALVELLDGRLLQSQRG